MAVSSATAGTCGQASARRRRISSSAARSAGVVGLPSALVRNSRRCSKPCSRRPASSAMSPRPSAIPSRASSSSLMRFPVRCARARSWIAFANCQCPLSGSVLLPASGGADARGARIHRPKRFRSRFDGKRHPRSARSCSAPLQPRLPRHHLAGRRDHQRPRGARRGEGRGDEGLRLRPHPEERRTGVGQAPVRPARLRRGRLGGGGDRPRRRRQGARRAT